jgi:hypothetical protein
MCCGDNVLPLRQCQLASCPSTLTAQLTWTMDRQLDILMVCVAHRSSRQGLLEINGTTVVFAAGRAAPLCCSVHIKPLRSPVRQAGGWCLSR